MKFAWPNAMVVMAWKVNKMLIYVTSKINLELKQCFKRID